MTFHIFMLTPFRHLVNPHVTPVCPMDRYITSDCDAVATVYEYQMYAKSPEDAVAYVLKAGLLFKFYFLGKSRYVFQFKN